MSMRTIWITLRAVSYASQAFKDVQKDLTLLINKELTLKKTNTELMQSTVKYAQAGLMFATLAQQMAGSILNMAMNSREGAGDMARLKQQIFLTTNALNNAAYEMLKSSGVLTLMNNVLKELQRNKALQFIVIGAIALVAALAALAAVAFLAMAAVNGLALVSKLASVAFTICNTAAGPLTITLGTLVALVAAAVISFTLLYAFVNQFKGIARLAVSAIMLIVGALILWATWQAIATNGLSLVTGIAAGAAVGAMGAGAVGAMGAFAGGTQSVQRTGPVFAHKGEVIYNPATNRPSQVGNDMNKGQSVTNMNTQITIENVHTKADYDDVAYQINKANRSGARSVR